MHCGGQRFGVNVKFSLTLAVKLAPESAAALPGGQNVASVQCQICPFVVRSPARNKE